MKLDQPMPYLPGRYVNAQIPQCPPVAAAVAGHSRAGRRRDRVPRPRCSRWPVQHGDRQRDDSGRPLAAGRSAFAARWRWDRDGGDVLMVAGGTGVAPLRTFHHGLGPIPGPIRGCTCSSGRAMPVSSTTCAPAWQIAARTTRGCRSPVAEFPDRSGPPTTRTCNRPADCDVGADRLPRGGDAASRRLGDRQILICGGPDMVPGDARALIAKGAPPERIPARSAALTRRPP